MKRIALAFAAALAILSTAACAGPQANPDYQAYINGQVSIAEAQSVAETNRLHALAAVAATGDDRVKDRAIAELSNSGNRVGITNVAQPQVQPSLGLELARIFVPALVQGYGIHSNTVNTRIAAEASVANNAITFGTIGNIAQGGYNLGGQGISAAQALGAAASAPVEAIPE